MSEHHLQERNMPATYWLELWRDPGYVKIKMDNVERILDYLGHPPNRLLDIGCGAAFESREFNRRFGTDIWLLDGDFDTTKDRERSTSWGSTSEMKFYSHLEDLRTWFQEHGVTKYHLVDANNITIPSDTQFDLIYSFLSCGYHYPVDTYRDLIRRHSAPHTKVLFDLRRRVKHDVDIVAVVSQSDKHDLCEIKI